MIPGEDVISVRCVGTHLANVSCGPGWCETFPWVFSQQKMWRFHHNFHLCERSAKKATIHADNLLSYAESSQSLIVKKHDPHGTVKEAKGSGKSCERGVPKNLHLTQPSHC